MIAAEGLYATRARIGLIVPPTNTVNEAEWRAMVPPGVGFHTHRMPLHADIVSPEGKAALHADLAASCAMLSPLQPDVIAYACTAGSMVQPPSALPDAMARECGVPCVTTSAAILAALSALGARTVSVATPYGDAMNAHERAYLADCGIGAARIAGLGIGAGGPHEYIRIARTPLAQVEAHARAAFVPGSDALVLLCTDMPTLPLVAALEDSLGVPVVTSNQATLWAALRTAGIADAPPGTGRLMTLPLP